ncbi:MAG: hypothetical protein COA58_00690 [Bacteroidetes bacterium]|nr:MAG: hypothetical protein COA58_00690 [Bacteroidota bacterium]
MTINALIILTLSWFSPQTTDSDQIIGNWISPNKDLIIHCFKGNDGKYHGKMAWFKVYPGDETHYDCDVSQEQWVGKTVLTKFTYQDNEWSGGTIKDLKKCSNYDAFIVLEPNGELTATGFIFFRWLSQSTTFSRYLGVLPKQE